MKTLYPNHPYGRPSNGTVDSLKAITGQDLEIYRKKVFAKDTLRVVVVGDITAQQASEMLDKVFGGLSAKAELVVVPDFIVKPAEKLKIVEMDVPQSVVSFGLPGVMRKDKDFMAAFVLNHIIGGGGFSSRLMEEVREKRGLAYSAYSYISPMRSSSLFAGGVATKNEQVGTSIDVIKSELKRMAADGPTADELANAKANLTGAFALRFDTNAKIANQLLYFLSEDLGRDYVERRNKEVDGITLDDMKRVAKRMLTDDLFITIVGKPKLEKG